MIEQAMTTTDLLPATAYSDPKFFQAERRGLFGRGWHPIAPLAALTRPGSYLALGFGGHPVFAITGDDGTARVFRNVCAHQQLPVLENGHGTCAELRCRFHGWTYDRAGTLVATPPTVAPKGALAKYGLDQCPSERTAALLVASLDPEPAAFDPVPWAPANRLAGVALAGSETVALPVNWKAVADILAGEAGLTGGFGGTWDWMAPTTGLAATADAAVLLQIVARTFRKTELHWHVYAETGATPDWPTPWIKALSAAAEQRATAIAAGSLPDTTEGDAVVALHGAVADATAEA